MPGCKHQHQHMIFAKMWKPTRRDRKSSSCEHPIFWRLATSGLLWYFRHVATCNHQKTMSALQRNNLEARRKSSPQNLHQLGILQPPKNNMEAENPSFQNESPLPEIPPFSGCNQLQPPHFRSPFPDLLGNNFPPKNSQSSHHRGGKGHKPQAKNQDLHLGVPAANPRLWRSGGSQITVGSTGDGVSKLPCLDRKPNKTMGFLLGMLFFTPSIYFSSNILSHVFWKYIEQFWLSMHVQNMRIQFFFV